jgi:hypothetical protein
VADDVREIVRCIRASSSAARKAVAAKSGLEFSAK